MLSEGTAHFGEYVRGSKFGDRVTRDLYAYPSRSPHQRVRREQLDEQTWADVAWAYEDEEHTRLSDAFLLVQRDAALVNFDLSMQYFASLLADEFEAALQHVIAEGKSFEPVQSLPAWDNVAGTYLMVFDEYRQFYIGQSNDVRRRIKKHWSGRKPFDRLIFGSKYNSIFPVDEFRALDTTRLYATRTGDRYAVERQVEGAADGRFCLNRMSGGEASPLMLMLTSATSHTRSHAVSSIDLSIDDCRREDDDVTSKIEDGRSCSLPNLGKSLATLDMSIYSVTRDTGTRFMWSRRDVIAEAAARGDLSVDEYAEFLTAMGETVVWP